MLELVGDQIHSAGSDRTSDLFLFAAPYVAPLHVDPEGLKAELL